MSCSLITNRFSAREDLADVPEIQQVKTPEGQLIEAIVFQPGLGRPT